MLYLLLSVILSADSPSCSKGHLVWFWFYCGDGCCCPNPPNGIASPCGGSVGICSCPLRFCESVVFVSIFGGGDNCDDKDWFWAKTNAKLVYTKKAQRVLEIRGFCSLDDRRLLF